MKGVKRSPIICALVLMLMLFTGSSIASAGPKVEIVAATTLGINEAVARALTEKFNAENSDIHVKLEAIPWTSIFDKMMVDFATGKSSYDVVWHSMSMLPALVRSGYLEPLDKYFNNQKLINKNVFDLNDFPQSLMPKLNGQLYHLPYMTGPQIMFCRKDLLDKAGLKVPATLEEFMAAVKKLHDPKNGVYGTVIHGTRSGAGGNTYQYYTLLNSLGGSILDSNGKVMIDQPEAIKALQLWLDMYKYSPPDSINWGAGAASEAMMAGNVALMLTYADHYARFLDPARSKVTDKIGWAAFPAGPAGSRPVAHVWSVSVSRFAKNKDAAFRYMTYLLDKKNMQTYLDAGGVPPRISVLTGPESKSVPALALSAKGLSTAVGVPLIKEYIKLEEILSVQLSEALAGSKSAETTLEDAAKQMKAVLK
jgi:multiple sugar transport system substrate-binding protein